MYNITSFTLLFSSRDNSSLDHRSHESVGSLIGKTLTLDVQDGRVLGRAEMETRMPFVCEGDPGALSGAACAEEGEEENPSSGTAGGGGTPSAAKATTTTTTMTTTTTSIISTTTTLPGTTLDPLVRISNKMCSMTAAQPIEKGCERTSFTYCAF